MGTFLVVATILGCICLHQVSGLQLVFEPSNGNVNLDASSPNTFKIICRLTSEDSDIQALGTLKLSRYSTDGTIEPIAVIAAASPNNDAFWATILQTEMEGKGGVLSGSYDSTNMLATEIQVSLNESLMACSDERMYQCDLLYYSKADYTGKKEKLATGNTTITAKPVLPISISARNMTGGGTGTDIFGVGTINNPAIFWEGQVVQLSCSASIGSNPDTKFSWRYNSYNNLLSTYNPVYDMKDDGQARDLVNCRYQRTGTIMYNMTNADLGRDSSNPLLFECFVDMPFTQGQTYQTPEVDRPKFYITVQGGSNNGGSAGGSTGGDVGNAGMIVGIVVGVVALIVIIVLLVYFLWFRRRAGGETYTTKEEQGASNPNLAPTYAVPDKRVGYDNKAIDEPRKECHHSRDRDDKDRRDDRDWDRHYENSNGRGRSNYAMDDEDYHSRDGSPTMTHSSHMGMDPVDGSIGTGV